MMDVINYFDSQQSVRNLLYLMKKLTLLNCVVTGRTVKNMKDYTLLNLNLEKKVFGCVIKTSNIVMQETQNLMKGTKNLELYQLEIQHLVCKK